MEGWPEVGFMIAEYNQLVEEIREGGHSSWLPRSAYIAASAEISAALTPAAQSPGFRLAGLPLYTVTIPMFAFGVLVSVIVLKLRILNDFAYARLWEAEWYWKEIANAGVGGRWNPTDADRLYDTTKYPRLHGLVDFTLLTGVLFIAVAWLAFGIAGTTDAGVPQERWRELTAWLVLVVAVILVPLFCRIRSKESAAHSDWIGKRRLEDVEKVKEPASARR